MNISQGTCIDPYLGTCLLILSHIRERLARTDDHAIFVDRSIKNGPGEFIEVAAPNSFSGTSRLVSWILDDCGVGGPSDGAPFADPESGSGATVPIIV